MNMENIDKIIEKAKGIETKQLVLKYDANDFKNKRVITYGTFDLFHIGHKKIIDHALEVAGDQTNLVIAISSDKWNELKGKKASQSQDVRLGIMQKEYPDALVIFEDHKFADESWPQHWDDYNIDLIIMGGDHVQNLSYINDKKSLLGRDMKITFYERTPEISSTLLRDVNK